MLLDGGEGGGGQGAGGGVVAAYAALDLGGWRWSEKRNGWVSLQGHPSLDNNATAEMATG